MSDKIYVHIKLMVLIVVVEPKVCSHNHPLPDSRVLATRPGVFQFV